MTYKRWITNCPEDEAFERLMKYSASDPSGYYMIGPPHETETMCSQNYSYDSILPYSKISKGCTAEYLEKIGYLGIYECYPPDFPYDS